METRSEVGEWFRGRSVFITGGTGFMGKVLVEKLLRSCPDIHTIYILMRPKRGTDVRTRLDDLVRSKDLRILKRTNGMAKETIPATCGFLCASDDLISAAHDLVCLLKPFSRVFDRLRSERPEFGSQIAVVRGDVTTDQLDLSEEDRTKLQKNVSVVFHCAANVRFDQKLKNAITFNTLGTKRVLQLAEGMQRLEAFIHVSTAYCHCDQPVLEEKMYPPPADPNNILQIVDWMDGDLLDTITPKLIGKLPNTYAYSKNLTEQLVSSYSSKFPIAIARPSIVTATWRDPFPGWVENLNGPTGLLVGAGKGVIRSMHCRAEYLADVMPCDLTINALIVLAWQVAQIKPKTTYVMNVTESGENPISWGDILDMGRKHLYDNPLNDAIWFPDGSIKRTWFIHMLCVIFFHFLPAYFIDFFVTMCGKKPFMVRIQWRIQGGLQMLQYYTNKKWVFSNDRFKAMTKALKPKDQTEFYMDVTQVNWDKYIKDVVLGTKVHCLKEDLAGLPKARRHLNRMYWLDRGVSVIFYLLFLWVLISWMDSMLQWSTAIPHLRDLTPLFRVLPEPVSAAEPA